MKAMARWTIFLWILLFQAILYPQNKNISIIQTKEGAYWNIANEKVSFMNGVVYQPVPPGHHIDDFVGKQDFYTLYKALLPVGKGGSGHGEALKAMKVDFIRIYQLSLTNFQDVMKIKKLFSYIYRQYGIRVLLGNWAGLHGDPNNYEGIQKNIETMVETYGNEDWLLGFLIGNENNYFNNDGILRNESTPDFMKIELSVEDYYNFMNRLALSAKKAMKNGCLKPIGLGSGEIFPSEIEYVKKEIQNYDFLGYNCYRTPDRMNDYLKLLKQRGVTLPVLITEFGTPSGGTALWGLNGLKPFDETLSPPLPPVIPKSEDPLEQLSALQKNYLRENFTDAIKIAGNIVNAKSEPKTAPGRSLKQIIAESLLIRGLCYKNTKDYEKAVSDFKMLLSDYTDISIWSLPIEPVTTEEREAIYRNAVRNARNNSQHKGTGQVLGICCFEFTDELWNNTEQNRGFTYRPSEDVKVDNLTDLSDLNK